MPRSVVIIHTNAVCIGLYLS